MPPDDKKLPKSFLAPPSAAPAKPLSANEPVASTVPIVPGSAYDPQVSATVEGLIGKILEGRYSIEKELGRGGIGAVYLARDGKLMSKPVVVKVLLDKSLQSDWVTKKFEQEKEALARVDHPGIVGILDSGELPDGKPYLVMQYVDGVSLRSALRQEGVGLVRAACVIKQAGSALSAAHEKGIFHRDLKPENIMLQVLSGGEEQVKIIDFGIAKVKNSQVAESTALGVSPGTVLYMSPEQLRGEKVTAASDIYSLGIIAYELVTGRRPFNPETGFQLAEMQRAGVTVRPQALRPALPVEAEAVILKALSFNPRDRYASARDFGDALEDALMGDEQTPACELYPDASTEDKPVPVKPQRKRLLSFAAILVAVLLVVGVAGAMLWSRLQPTVEQRTQFDTSAPAQPAQSKPAATGHILSYWLTVQKMRDGNPYKEPFESSGQEIFENGYKFRLNVLSREQGYLYLLNEGLSADGANSFTLLYPTPVRNDGSARLDAERQIETAWNVFGGQNGTERFWIAWAAAPVPELESARDAAFKSGKGALTDAAQIVRVREFLKSHAVPDADVSKDKATKRTVISSNNDILVNLLELEHQ